MLLARLEELSVARELRAECQAGFRDHARLEDNVLLLQTALQHSHHIRRPLHLLFVDLAKAYDTINRSMLWDTLLRELQLPRGLVCQLQQLYKDTSVLLAGAEHLGAIPVNTGLKQGCPASPLLFLLFFDRLEAAVKLAAGSCTPYLRHFLRYLALQLLILLFADDVVLLAWTHEGLETLFVAFREFCRTNCLTISAAKTVAMLPRHPDPPSTITLAGDTFSVVPQFRYLGVQLDHRGAAATICAAFAE